MLVYVWLTNPKMPLSLSPLIEFADVQKRLLMVKPGLEREVIKKERQGEPTNLSLNLNLDLTLRQGLLKTLDPGLLDLDPDDLLDEDVLD